MPWPKNGYVNAAGQPVPGTHDPISRFVDQTALKHCRAHDVSILMAGGLAVGLWRGEVYLRILRNDGGDRGDVGIIRSSVRASIPPTSLCENLALVRFDVGILATPHDPGVDASHKFSERVGVCHSRPL